jgi:ankyrin repeat protein
LKPLSQNCLPIGATNSATTFNKNPTPLIVAAYLDNVPLACLLLKNGAKVGTAPFDDSAGHSARSAEIVQLLLDFHADPEMRNRNNLTPLHFYAHWGNIPATRAVLQRGVKVDPVSEGIPSLGQVGTPIHGAARRGNVDAVKLLLEFGANVHSKNHSGNTPLHLAARAGEIEVVRLLVERWPDGVKVKCNNLDTPLHWAAEAEDRSSEVIGGMLAGGREGEE